MGRDQKIRVPRSKIGTVTHINFSARERESKLSRSPRSTSLITTQKVWRFTERVFSVVAKITTGKVLTYKEVAQRAGNPRAYRAVGNILSKNFNPNIPCHRVIKSSGALGEYNRGRAKKKALLKKEGAIA